jgi:hypothetical protein
MFDVAGYTYLATYEMFDKLLVENVINIIKSVHPVVNR